MPRETAAKISDSPARESVCVWVAAWTSKLGLEL